MAFSRKRGPAARPLESAKDAHLCTETSLWRCSAYLRDEQLFISHRTGHIHLTESLRILHFGLVYRHIAYILGMKTVTIPVFGHECSLFTLALHEHLCGLEASLPAHSLYSRNEDGNWIGFDVTINFYITTGRVRIGLYLRFYY